MEWLGLHMKQDWPGVDKVSLWVHWTLLYYSTLYVFDLL